MSASNQAAAPHTGRSSRYRRSAAVLTAAVLVLGLGLTAAAVRWADQRIQAEARSRFDNHATRLEEAVRARFDHTLAGFKSLRASLEANPGPMQRAEFRAWAASRDVAREFPGVRGLGFIERVQRQDLDAFIARERADAAPEFTVQTSGVSPDLLVIKNIEPLAPNRRAWGYDIGSEYMRRAGATRAILSGQPSLTAKIVLVQDGQNRPGLLYFLPLYTLQGGQRPETPAQRDAALRGLIYAPIVLEEVMSTVEFAADRLLDFEVYDGKRRTPDALLYDHVSRRACALPARQAGTAADCAPPQFSSLRDIDIGGRTLHMVITGTAAFEASVDQSTPAWIAACGALVSGMLAAVLWLSALGRSNAMALAARKTRDLAQETKRAEAAVRDTDALLKTLDQHAIVSVTDPTGRITAVNDAFCRISGHAREELIGENHRIVNSGLHAQSFWSGVWHTIGQGQPWRGELCNRAKDGSLYWVDTFIAPFLSADGQVEKYVSIRIDITAAKNAERELLAYTKRFELAVEGSAEGLWEWVQAKGQRHWWSPQFYRLLGYEPGEVAADQATFEALVHPDDLRTVGQVFRDAVSGHQFSVDFKMRTKAGEYRWFRARGKVFRDEHGELLRMAGSLQDIHERRVANEQVRERNAQLNAVLSLSPDAFVSFGPDHRVSLVSPPFTALTGIEAEEVTGLDEAAFLDRLQQGAAPASHVASLADMQIDLSDPSRHRVVLELLSPSRRMLRCALHASRAGAVSQLLLLRDVTHETEVERLKSEFLSMAAHELRTPMASIMGFTELMLMREMPPARQRDMLERILRNSQTMTELINELLDLARIEARRSSDFKLEAMELADLSRQVAADFQPPAGREAPVLEPGPQALWVRVDQAKLRQAVLNLVSNAYKYSGPGKPVRLALLTEGTDNPRHGVRVIDQGMGLSEEQLSHIGERFYRADKTGAIPGTGLGMSIVKETIELLGGSLQVTSQLGVGTEVTLWLPAILAPEVAPDEVATA